MRLSALETSEIGNEIGGEIGNKIGRARVSNTIVGRSPYGTTNPGRRDCSTKGHEISGFAPFTLATHHHRFPYHGWILRFLRFSTVPNCHHGPVLFARCWLERSRMRGKRDWIKTCCRVLMREIGQLAAFGQQKLSKQPGSIWWNEITRLRWNQERIPKEGVHFRN